MKYNDKRSCKQEDGYKVLNKPAHEYLAKKKNLGYELCWGKGTNSHWYQEYLCLIHKLTEILKSSSKVYRNTYYKVIILVHLF